MKRILVVVFVILLLFTAFPSLAEFGEEETITVDTHGKLVSGGAIRTGQAVRYLSADTNAEIDALIKKAELIIQCVVEYAPQTPPQKLKNGGIQEHSLQLSFLYKGKTYGGSEFWLDIDRTKFLPGKQVDLRVGDRVLLFLGQENDNGSLEPLYFAYDSATNDAAGNEAYARVLDRVKQKCKKQLFFSDDAGMVYGMEKGTPGARFVFPTAPVTDKTSYWLDQSGAERVTIHRFRNEKDFAVCFDMVKGYGLSYKEQLVYPNSNIPYTWYVNKEAHVLALYCGINEDMRRDAGEKAFTALDGFSVLSGYFKDNVHTQYPFDPIFKNRAGETVVISPPPVEHVGTISEVLQNTDGICIAKVKKAPVWPENSNRMLMEDFTALSLKMKYELEVLEDIKNAGTGYITIFAEPGRLAEGKTYLLFLREGISADGEDYCTMLASGGAGPFALELDDHGRVLPLYQYDMKAIQLKEAFLKTLQRNRYYKAVPADHMQRMVRELPVLADIGAEAFAFIGEVVPPGGGVRPDGTHVYCAELKLGKGVQTFAFEYFPSPEAAQKRCEDIKKNGSGGEMRYYSCGYIVAMYHGLQADEQQTEALVKLDTKICTALTAYFGEPIM